jgi:hypothetical protein
MMRLLLGKKSLERKLKVTLSQYDKRKENLEVKLVFNQGNRRATGATRVALVAPTNRLHFPTSIELFAN